MNTDSLIFAAMLTLVVLSFLYIVRSLKGLCDHQKRTSASVHSKMAKAVKASESKVTKDKP